MNYPSFTARVYAFILAGPAAFTPKPSSFTARVYAFILASIVLLGTPGAQATTYTWANSNVTGTPVTPFDWFTGGPNTQGTWTGGDPTGVLTNADTIKIFQDNTTLLPNTANPSSQTTNINNGGSAVELGTLTLTGKTSTTANRALTMTISGDALNFSAATGTINLDAVNGVGTSVLTYNVNSDIQLGTASSATALTITGNGGSTFNISGNISELQSGGGSSIVKSGSSTAKISGNITLSGGLSISNGQLYLTGNNASMSGGITLSGGTLQIDASSNANALGGSGNTIDFSNSATLYNSNNTYTVLQGISVTGTSTIATFLGAFGEVTNVSGNVTGDGQLRISSGSNGFITNLNGSNNTISGTVWVGSNTSGNTTLNVNSLADGASGKTLKLGNGGITADFVLQGSSVTPIVWTNRAVELAGTTGAISISNNSSNAARTLTISPNLSFTASSSGNKTLTLGGSNTGANTFGGNITNNGSSTTAITKAGNGKWIITGDMSNTGGLSVNAGTLTLSGTNTYSGNTNFTGSGPTLILAGMQAVSPNTTFVTNTNASTGASTIKLLDDTGGVNNSTVSVTNTFKIQNNNSPGNAHTFIVGNNNTANGGTSSGTTTGSTIAIGTLNWGTEAATTTAYGPIQIQGTDGYRLQINSVVLHNAANLTSGTAGNTFFTPTTANVTLGTVTVGTGNTGQGYQTLVLDGTSSDNRVTGTISDASDVGTSGRPLRVTKSNSSTWTLSGSNSYTGNTTLTGGTLSVGLTDNLGDAASNLVFNGGTLQITGTTLTNFSGIGHTVSFTAAKTVGLDIADATNTFTVDQVLNQTTGGFTKSGTGRVILSQTNTYTGTTTISGGVLQAIEGSTIGTNTGISLDGGVFQSSGTFTRSVGAVSSAGSTTYNMTANGGGFSAIGGKFTVNLNNTATVRSWGSTVSTSPLVGTLKFGSSSSDSEVEMTNNINFNGADRTIDVTAGVGGDFATLSGVLSNSTGTAGFSKTGTGKLVLTNTNTYNGKTSVQNGTVSFSAGNASATADQQLGKNTDLDLGVASTSSGTLLYTGGADTLAKNINVVGNGGDTIQNGGSGLLTLTGTLTKDGTTLTLKGGSNGIIVSGTGTIAGSSANSDLVIDGGVTTLATANTYNGPTSVINNGTLFVTNTTGSATSTGNVTVDSGSTLGGTGFAGSLTSAPDITINGVLMTGITHDVDTVGGGVASTLTLLSSNGGSGTGIITLGGMVQFDLFNRSNPGGLNPTTDNDLLRINSDTNVDLGGSSSLVVKNPNGLTFANNDSWQLFDWTGNSAPLTGNTFNSYDLPGGLSSWNITQLYTAGTITYLGAAPEPSRAILMLIGATGLMMRRRRKG